MSKSVKETVFEDTQRAYDKIEDGMRDLEESRDTIVMLMQYDPEEWESDSIREILGHINQALNVWDDYKGSLEIDDANLN